MKTLVTYASSTGNTKKIAQAIHDALDGEKYIHPIDEVSDASGYDLVFVGFPVVGETMPGKVRRFVRKKLKGKKVALFFTHGMPSDMSDFKDVMPNCIESAAGTKIIGAYDCQGNMVPWVPKVLRLHPFGYVRRWAKMGPEAHGAGRPNIDDIAAAQTFARSVAAKSI
ncbi:MAG: flavodoxin [Methanomassiliicoccales archaeon PtaU1.Bin124]|nr:MAG: flavodoxin [Methanomassiliicoccales archaeon PtaU1.Bin124]